MSTFAAVGAYSREDDWIIAGLVVFISYVIVYPLYLLMVRVKHTRRIKKQLVTSIYKLPINLNPAEVSYVFTARIGRRQIYATLLDLTNRGVLIMHKKGTKTYMSLGPKHDSTLTSYEHLLIDQLHEVPEPLEVDKMIKNSVVHELSKTHIIRGSTYYVFWYLLRDHLRKSKLIERRMTGKYAKMLFFFGVVWSLVLAVVPLVSFRVLQILDSGEVNLTQITQVVYSGLLLWSLVVPFVVFFSFFLLRLRGHMIGRAWLMTDRLSHYLHQFEAFREFVRLTHSDRLHFESKELLKEARATTLPYAIAFGYVKE